MNRNVSLVTQESDLDFVYGPYYGKHGKPKNLDQALCSVKYLLTDIHDLQHTYFRLGFHLNEMMTHGYYWSLGFPGFEDFCVVNLGMDRSAVSRCISVFKTFCQRDKDGSCKAFIEDRYSNYSYSQLCEMLPMSEDQREKVKPEMTVREIRDLKKGVAMSQQTKKEKKDNSKILDLYGAARSSFIRNLDLDDMSNIGLYIYDRDGKPIFEFNNICVNCIYAHLSGQSPCIHIRFDSYKDPLEGSDKND